MVRILIASSLLAALSLFMPGSSPPASAAAGGKIKIASLTPRGSALEKAYRKLDVKLKDMTGGAWGIKFFPSGIAGDEVDVIRKMNVGQMDAAIITTTGLSQIVREVAVFDAPGAITSYKHLDKAKKALWPDLQKSFEKKGVRLLGWGEGGEYRWYSKKPLKRISDIKHMRPWVWPASYVLKELIAVVGATGVPLGVPEVYGGLQTDMIDAVVSTSIAAAGLQWWSKVKYMTADTAGNMLLMGFTMTDKRWKELPESVQKVLADEVERSSKESIATVRTDDLKTYKKLAKRGVTPIKWEPDARKEWEDVVAPKVRARLIGRVYPKELLDKVMALAD